MKRQTLQFTAAFFMLIATLGSCQKGDVGATGAQGATGATGAAGTNGTNGTNGATGATGATGAQGNANVQEILGTITASDWGWSSTNLYNYANFTSLSQITSDIMSTGMVLAFISNASPQTYWYALPYTAWGSPSFTYQYSYELNFLEVQYSTTAQTNVPPTGTTYVKIVVVASAIRKANPNINWRNYDEIKAMLGDKLVETTMTLH